MTGKSDRIVIDTNLWISFLLIGDYSKLDNLLRSNAVVLLFSEELLEEFVEVASRPKFRKYFPVGDLTALLNYINTKSEFINVTSTVDVCRDPKDNFLLSLALDGEATHLISGDKDLLSIKKFSGTLILPMSKYINNK